MKWWIIGSAVVVFIFSLWTLQYRAGDMMLVKYGLNDMTVRQKIAYLEQSQDDRTLMTAGVTGTALFLTLEGKEFNFQLPANEFYLSVAPYIENTHPCGTHSLVTCRGELANMSFYVTIRDSQGQIVDEGIRTSYANGFIGLWLEKGFNGTLTIEKDGLIATAPLSLTSTTNTCLTTMQLQ